MHRKIIILTVMLASSVVAISLSASGGDRRTQAVVPVGPTAIQAKGDAVDPEAQAADRLADKTRPRGTSFAPHPKAVGRVRDAMRKISDEFAAKEPPATADRLAHFNDVAKNHRINGWYGVIQDVGAEEDRIVFRVRISPYLARESATVVHTTDYYEEDYEIVDGQLNYLGGAAPAPGRLNLLFTD